jgi:hypothetical protein
MNVDNNRSILFDYNASASRSINFSKAKLLATKSNPYSPLDLRSKEQKIDDLIKHKNNTKITSKPTPSVSKSKLKEVIVPNVLDLEDRMYLMFVNHNIHTYDSNHKAQTLTARIKFIKELFSRYIQTECYWSDYYQKVSNLGAMDDIYLTLLQQTLSPKIEDITPYVDFLIELDEMLYFKLPSKLKTATWDMWEVVQLGSYQLLFVNHGDYRIKVFADNAMYNPKSKFYGILTEEQLLGE